jgi:DNA polymerase V
MRIPEAMVEEVLTYVHQRGYNLPFYSCSVSAGQPLPADDDSASRLTLNDYLIENPKETFFVRVVGDSMIEANISDGDILIVDRSVPVTFEKIVVAAVDGQLTVKRFVKKDGKTYLMPENRHYRPIEMTEDSHFVIWGVVTTVLHRV